MGERSFKDYRDATDALIAGLGKARLVDDLAAEDFAALRAAMAKKWGPVRLANTITRIKTVFKYGLDNGIIERAVRYGSEFNKPDKAVMRKHRASKPAKMLEADEVRALIARADPTLRAMIHLGVNCAFGNADCANLALDGMNLDTGWIDFPRPKTGIARRCPLWPETVSAIRAALEERPEPRADSVRERVFLTVRGNAFIHTMDGFHKDRITIQFTRLLKQLGFHRDGVSFYALRHTFRTVADAARDSAATDLIMGHTDPSMAAVYRERIDDARLRAVVDHVRNWLWPGDSTVV